jgi:hypothetical protein
MTLVHLLGLSGAFDESDLMALLVNGNLLDIVVLLSSGGSGWGDTETYLRMVRREGSSHGPSGMITATILELSTWYTAS